MNPRYRETFRRHRLLFLLPVGLGMVFGLLVALGSPTLYRSDATLAFKSLDTTASQFGATPPAAQNQAILNELLATHTFPETVARKSPLEEYLRTHTSTGWGPTALIKRLLKGPPTLDDRIAEAFNSKHVFAVPSGPGLLEISFEAPDPRLARATLRVLVNEFLQQRLRLQGNALTAAIAAFTNARRQLAQAQSELKTYTGSHPGSTTSSDPELAQLTHAQLQAVRQLRDAASLMNTAMAAVNGGSGLPTTVFVIDQPRLPVGPTTGKKRVVELAFVGGFVGALLSFLLIMFVSRQGPSQAPAVIEPAPVAQPSSNGGDPAVPEHEQAAQLLAGQERHLREIRRE